MRQTALDADPSALDAAEATFVSHIREYGWTRTNVFADDEGPGFSYSTGFSISENAPELIVFAMKSEICHDVLWDLFRDVMSGDLLPIGVPSDAAFANGPAYFFPVAKRHYAEYLGWNGWFYAGDNFQCLQLVWSDRANLFPWQSGFDPEFVGLQPDLTERGWLAELRA